MGAKYIIQLENNTDKIDAYQYNTTKKSYHFVTEPYAAVPVRIQTPEVSVSEASMQIVAFLKNDFTDTKHVHVNVFLCDEMNRIVKEKQLKLKLIPGRKYPISTSEEG